MVTRYQIGAFLPVVFLLGCQSAPTPALLQIDMQTEDSHPHEILPEKSARFPFWQADHGGYIDVKCTLSGHAVTFALKLSKIKAIGWAARQARVIDLDGELQVDIEGTVTNASTAVYFEFINHSPTQMLWHQCYNN